MYTEGCGEVVSWHSMGLLALANGSEAWRYKGEVVVFVRGEMMSRREEAGVGSEGWKKGVERADKAARISVSKVGSG